MSESLSKVLKNRWVNQWTPFNVYWILSSWSKIVISWSCSAFIYTPQVMIGCFISPCTFVVYLLMQVFSLICHLSVISKNKCINKWMQWIQNKCTKDIICCRLKCRYTMQERKAATKCAHVKTREWSKHKDVCIWVRSLSDAATNTPLHKLHMCRHKDTQSHRQFDLWILTVGCRTVWMLQKTEQILERITIQSIIGGGGWRWPAASNPCIEEKESGWRRKVKACGNGKDWHERWEEQVTRTEGSEDEERDGKAFNRHIRHHIWDVKFTIKYDDKGALGVPNCPTLSQKPVLSAASDLILSVTT